MSSISGTYPISVGGLSFSSALANDSFSSIQVVSLRNLNPAVFTAVDAGAGVGATAPAFFQYLNYQYSNLANPPPFGNITAIGNCSATDDGILIVNYVDALVATNGLAGYCDLEIAITNTSNANITPTNFDVFIFVKPA
jgi:hypothetical protein